MIWIILPIILIVGAIWYNKKFYHVNIDHTIMYTGAPGTGKTNEMVLQAVRLYKMVKRQVKRKNRINRLFKKPLLEMPRLYSNIPIKLRKNVFSYRLKIEHLLLTERLSYKAVTVITELGKIASQYDWQNLNVQDNLNDFISMYRQYTKGGYFLCDDQSSDNIAVTIRRRLGTVVNMLHFKHWWKLYWVKMRNMTISEDIKTIETDVVESNMRWRLGIFPLFGVRYDTFAFSERYNTVPKGTELRFYQYKTNEIMNMPNAEKIKTKEGSEVKGKLFNKKIQEKD